MATIACTLPPSTIVSVPNTAAVAATSTGGLLAEALLGGYPSYAKSATAVAIEPSHSKDNACNNNNNNNNDDLPLGATFETAGLANSMSPSSNNDDTVNIELDNAGRVKSGKVRSKLCFFKVRLFSKSWSD